VIGCRWYHWCWAFLHIKQRRLSRPTEIIKICCLSFQKGMMIPMYNNHKCNSLKLPVSTWVEFAILDTNRANEMSILLVESNSHPTASQIRLCASKKVKVVWLLPKCTSSLKNVYILGHGLFDSIPEVNSACSHCLLCTSFQARCLIWAPNLTLATQHSTPYDNSSIFKLAERPTGTSMNMFTYFTLCRVATDFPVTTFCK